MHKSVKIRKREYLNTLHTDDLESITKIPVWHFCDNKEDADDCARLVLSGKKRATSPSVWELELSNDEIPKVGDLNLITNWDGVAQCIIRTVAVEIVPFNKVTSKHAALEGEGDGSLEYWRDVHQSYYERVLKGSDYEIKKDMPIVFEQFEVIYPNTKVN